MANFKLYKKTHVEGLFVSSFTSSTTDETFSLIGNVLSVKKEGKPILRAELKESKFNPNYLEIGKVEEWTESGLKDDLRFAFQRAHEYLGRLGLEHVLYNNKENRIFSIS